MCSLVCSRLWEKSGAGGGGILIAQWWIKLGDMGIWEGQEAPSPSDTELASAQWVDHAWQTFSATHVFLSFNTGLITFKRKSPLVFLFFSPPHLILKFGEATLTRVVENTPANMNFGDPSPQGRPQTGSCSDFKQALHNLRSC